MKRNRRWPAWIVPTLAALACACAEPAVGTLIPESNLELVSSDGRVRLSFERGEAFDALLPFEAILEPAMPWPLASVDVPSAESVLRSTADLQFASAQLEFELPHAADWRGELWLDVGTETRPVSPSATTTGWYGRWTRFSCAAGSDHPSCSEFLLRLHPRTLDGFCASTLVGEPCLLCADRSGSCRSRPDLFCDEDSVCREIRGADDPLAALVPPDMRVGLTFVMTELQVAPAGVGLADAESRCRESTYCPTNQAWPLQTLNDQVRQMLLGGEYLGLIELRTRRESEDLEARVLRGFDADRPSFPGNNLWASLESSPPAAEPATQNCCQFLADGPVGRPDTPFRPATRTGTRLEFPMADHALWTELEPPPMTRTASCTSASSKLARASSSTPHSQSCAMAS